MDINQKLLSVLEHCYKTNVEYVEDGEIIPGVTPDEVLKMIEMLQPVTNRTAYKELLEDTLRTMDDHIVNMMEDVERERSLEKYDLTVTLGSTISRLPMN